MLVATWFGVDGFPISCGGAIQIDKFEVHGQGPSKLCAWNQGRTDVRWRPGQEIRLAPAGSKCTVLKKIFATLLGLFGDLIDSASVELPLGTSVHRRSQGGPRGPCPLITYISCRFVLWGAVSQTKHYCSLKVKIFSPPKILGWLRYCAPLREGQWLPTRNCEFLLKKEKVERPPHQTNCMTLCKLKERLEFDAAGCSELDSFYAIQTAELKMCAAFFETAFRYQMQPSSWTFKRWIEMLPNKWQYHLEIL